MTARFAAVLFILLFFVATSPAFGGPVPTNWEKWESFPNATVAPRFTANRIQELLLAGEKMVFIYAGYKTDKIVCGSIYLPYTWVPPFGSGARVNLNIPKDTWMVAYCP